MANVLSDTKQKQAMMTSSNGNLFHVTGHLWGEFTGHRGIPAQRPVKRSFDVFFDLPWINGWVNNGEAGDLRRYRAHYDVIVMDAFVMLAHYRKWRPRLSKLPSLCKKQFIQLVSTVALKGHHYISFSLHYINFDLCEKKYYVIMYT